MTGDRAGQVSRLYAGPFPALEDALVSSLPGMLARSRGEEHVLLVPSNELREHLLRRLAARWEGCAAGSSIMTLYDFARRLLKHRGIFPRELPPAQMAAALLGAAREVYAPGEGDFAAIAGKPGFVPALARTLADLDEGWIGDEALAGAARDARARGDSRRAARFSEWRRLCAAAERKVRAMGGMTRRRIFQEAVAGFEQPGYPFRVTLYGFYDFTRLQWTLVTALLESGLLEDVYFPGLFDEAGALSPAFGYAALTWDRLSRAFEGNVALLADRAPPEVADVRREIFAPGPPAGTRPAPLAVLSAPHEEGEMRLAARQALAWRDAAPGEEILLVARRLDEAAVSAWERAAAEYGIRTVERLAVPLSSVPPVRLLLQMIEAAARDFPRRQVIDILASPYRRPASDPRGGGPAPRPDLWDILSRECLVVSGKDWETRLPRRRPRRADGGEPEARREEDVQIGLLAAEVRALRASLRPVVRAAGYGPLALALRDLLTGGFRFVDDESREAERDRRALSLLLSLIADVARIPEREVPWPGATDALAWFSAILAGQRLFLGESGGMRVPGTVVAGDVHALRGVTADRVIFLSVNEDAVPAQVDEDPLLPDDDRAILNRMTRQAGLPEALSLLRRNAAEEKLLFSLPAASARRGLAFSVLRADAEGAAKRPSRYLLQLLARFAGPEAFSDDWAGASGARVSFLPRSPDAMLSAPGPLSARERALSDWRAGRSPGDGGAGVPWRRIAGTLSALGDREAGLSLYPGPWPGAGDRSRRWSATELDELARCPYRFLLRHRLGLSPAEEPEEEVALSPADAGVILHDILRTLGKDAASGKGWGDAGAAAARAFARFARANPTGLPGLFRIQCQGIARDAAAFVEWQRSRSSAPGAFRVEAVEQEFSVPEGRALPAFLGRVDRIDRGPDGEAEIIDYKYRDGKRERAPLDWIAHGLANQIPVYLAFAQALSPPPPEVRASLFFLKNGVRPVTVTGDQWKALREAWAGALSGWIAVAASGGFPPLPHHRFSYAGGAPPRYCDACAFKDHCRASPAFEGSKADEEALLRRVAAEAGLSAVGAHRPPRGR
ncbi:MAG: PD-(D/E)XK nuclease family protein [Gemmatimonadota bacterium]